MEKIIGRFGLFLGFFVFACLSGCSTKTIYYWGEYEKLIYTQYSNPSEAPPEMQIQTLEADIQKAKSAGKPLPPGFYAHLGYQYLLLGKRTAAKNSFIAEKTRFPESAVLMDRLISKIK